MENFKMRHSFILLLSLFSFSCGFTWNQNLCEWLEGQIDFYGPKSILWVSSTASESQNGSEEKPFSELTRAISCMNNPNINYIINNKRRIRIRTSKN
ncbi:MAG: hypothetical protein IJR49_03195 [Treponema sp.]|nr:hypothetical protein [Treponema sp.]